MSAAGVLAETDFGLTSVARSSSTAAPGVGITLILVHDAPQPVYTRSGSAIAEPSGNVVGWFGSNEMM